MEDEIAPSCKILLFPFPVVVVRTHTSMDSRVHRNEFVLVYYSLLLPKMTFLTKKDVEHCFDVIWFSIFDIQHSCLCSLNALNQMCRTYNVSVPASDNFEFPNSPCLNDWDLVHFVSHSNEPVFRVFHKCIMCCFLEQRIVVFRDGLCILKNSNSWLLLDALRDITKHEKDKENPFFYFFAVCEALMNLWRQRMNSTLAGSSQPRNVFALTWQRERSLSHAQQLRLELKEFCRGISFLFHEKMENAISYDPLGTSSSSPRPHATTTLMLYLQVCCLHWIGI